MVAHQPFLDRLDIPGGMWRDGGRRSSLITGLSHIGAAPSARWPTSWPATTHSARRNWQRRSTVGASVSKRVWRGWLAAGLLRADSDPRALALAIFSSLQGGLLLTQTMESLEPLDAALTGALTLLKAQGVAAGLNGLQTPDRDHGVTAMIGFLGPLTESPTEERPPPWARLPPGLRRCRWSCRPVTAMGTMGGGGRADGDIVIRGGSLIDGSGAPARAADVAVSDGRIVGVGKGLKGERELDATGQVVAPGFHRHPHPLRRPGVLGSLAHALVVPWRHLRGRRELCGFSIAPVRPELVPLLAPHPSSTWRT